MFGIGIGELILIILVTFLVAPRQIPKVMRKIAEFIGTLKHARDEFIQIGEDVKEIVGTELPTEEDLNPSPRRKNGQGVRMPGRAKTRDGGGAS